MSFRTLSSPYAPIALSEAVEKFPTLAAREAFKMSENYRVFTTADVIERLQARDFSLNSISTVMVRNPDRRPYAKHLIRMRHNGATNFAGAVPEVCIVNSHDGSSAWVVFAGLMRYVCLNNVVAGTVFSRYRVPHMGRTLDNVIDASYSVVDDTAKIADTVQRWQSITLSEDRAEAMAREAHTIRFGDNSDADVAERFQPARLLEARRDADKGSDLWTVYNRLQENTVRGGLKSIMVDNNKVSTRTIRPVQNINKQIDVNTRLWDLAERYSQRSPIQAAMDYANAA